jgi:hypothetical protein
VEGPQAHRAGDRLVGVAMGTRAPGLAPGVLGHGGEVSRRRVRHPRRRASGSRGCGCTTRCSPRPAQR